MPDLIGHSVSLPPPSASAYATYRDPSISSPACYHHRIPTCAPGTLFDPSHRSNSDRVAMYCATVFWRRLRYSSIAKNPDSFLTVAAKVCFH